MGTVHKQSPWGKQLIFYLFEVHINYFGVFVRRERRKWKVEGVLLRHRFLQQSR